MAQLLERGALLLSLPAVWALTPHLGHVLALKPPVSHIFGFSFCYYHIKYLLWKMLKIKYDINQQYLKTVDLHFVKSEWFSLTWSCGSRQRDTTLSGWKFKLNNLAAKGLREIYCFSPLNVGTLSRCLYLWAKHCTTTWFTWLRCKWVPDRTEISICTPSAIRRNGCRTLRWVEMAHEWTCPVTRG